MDYVADPPPEKIEVPRSGLPEKTFLRPSFSPKGRTAFEFKAGARLQLEKVAEQLNGKLSKINVDQEMPISGIVGGVVVTDIRVPLRTAKKNLRDFGVYIWDINTLCFLASKIIAKKLWRKPGVTIMEEKLTEWATVLRSVGTYRNCLKIKAAVYFQNPFKELDLDETKNLLGLLTQRVQELTKEITLMTYVDLEVHSISGTTEALDENFHRIVKRYNQNLIAYAAEDALLMGYNIAPWHCFPSLIKL